MFVFLQLTLNNISAFTCLLRLENPRFHNILIVYFADEKCISLQKHRSNTDMWRTDLILTFLVFQVPPAELEALLITHPDIEDAAVIGLPNIEAGELPMAFVVRKADATLTERDVELFVDENVAPYKKLRGGVEFIDEIPKSLSGKILRRELKDKLKELTKVEKPINSNRSFRRSVKISESTRANGASEGTPRRQMGAPPTGARSQCCIII